VHNIYIYIYIYKEMMFLQRLNLDNDILYLFTHHFPCLRSYGSVEVPLPGYCITPMLWVLWTLYYPLQQSRFTSPRRGDEINSFFDKNLNWNAQGFLKLNLLLITKENSRPIESDSHISK